MYIYFRTHGFDDQGRQFDLNGNLVDWWKEKTTEHYLEKAQCIVEQYANYTESATGLKVCTIELAIAFFSHSNEPFRFAALAERYQHTRREYC